MLSCPVKLEEDDGTIMATSSDFPELTTFSIPRWQIGSLCRLKHESELQVMNAVAARSTTTSAMR